jgi:hypothetical protein
MVSDALHRVAEKAKDEQEAALLEKAVKEASSSGYAGACCAMIRWFFDVYLILSMLLAASETVCLGVIFIFILGWGKMQTTSTLHVFLLAMVLYPEVQARAQEEIDSVIGEGLKRLPDWDDRASMPYVDAVIRETLRWFPVVPLGKCDSK